MGTQPPPQKGGGVPPNFWPMSIVAKRLDRSAQATLWCSMGTQPLPKKGAEPPPQFWAHFYCDKTAGCTKMPLGTELRLSPGDFVLDGDPAPPQKGGGAPTPKFSARLLWPNGWIDQDGTWHGGGPWSRPHCARWGPSFPPPKRGQSPQFSAHFCSRQTAGWIKMALGMEEGLGPGDFVLDGDPATPRTEGTPTTT